jgi:hypothetical protein
MRHALAIIALPALLLTGIARAEQPSERPLPLLITVGDDTGARRVVRCDDFTKDSDGVWSSVRTIRIEDVYLAPPVRFPAMFRINGVQVGAIVDAQCQGDPPR